MILRSFTIRDSRFWHVDLGPAHANFWQDPGVRLDAAKWYALQIKPHLAQQKTRIGNVVAV
jgi:hypothetical protein